ncbi:MAG: hypothetical protein ABIU63_10305 [Chitinophagaceae bacterium]
MNRRDVILLSSVLITFIFLYLPVSSATYLYTDEAVQLWEYHHSKGFHMFLQQGRYITEMLFHWRFGNARTVSDVSSIRQFSLTGWLLCIPVWYFIIRNVVIREKLPQIITFLSMVYLIAMPPMTISLVWASCMELFIANTCGLLSGYCLYNGITKDKHDGKSISNSAVCGSLIFGLVALFTYQTGFGCFFLPFIIHLVAAGKPDRKIVIGIITSVTIYFIYLLLFRFSLQAYQVTASNRTDIHIDVLNKLIFFMGRPLASAFHFTFLFNERSQPGTIVYLLLAASALAAILIQRRAHTVKEQISYLGTLFVLLGLIYLPAFLVEENYSSNRTLMALKMAVFIVLTASLCIAFRSIKKQYAGAAVMAVLFVANAWYNLHYLFLWPVKQEYQQLTTAIEATIRPTTDTVYFLRPPEDFFEKKYSITRSWDEFGVPSSFFAWVPPYLVKQVVLEKTANSRLAEKLVIIHSLNRDSLLLHFPLNASNVVYIDGPAMLK